MVTDDDARPSINEFGESAINQIFDIWVGPELGERGVQLSRESIRKVVVELEPGKAPRVLLNEEATISASFTAKRAIEPGEPVTADDIENLNDLRPDEVSPNSGWICFARIGQSEYVAFDFRYNRERALALLVRAGEFLTAARHAADEEFSNVAIDLAHSAAELTVQAQMLTQQNETNNHYERRRWLSSWAEHDNSPRQHSDILWNLSDLREQARYGSDQVRLKPGRLLQILELVQDMIDLGSHRISHKPE